MKDCLVHDPLTPLCNDMVQMVAGAAKGPLQVQRRAYFVSQVTSADCQMYTYCVAFCKPCSSAGGYHDAVAGRGWLGKRLGTGPNGAKR